MKFPPKWRRPVRHDLVLMEWLYNIPEVERYWRLAWWSGFWSMFGVSLERKLAVARKESLAAIEKYEQGRIAQ